MRRAAALATAIVLGLLLLLTKRPGQERSARDRQEPSAPEESARTSAREAPEPKGREEPGAAETGALAQGVVTDALGRPVAGTMVFAIPGGEEKLWDMEEPELPRSDAPDLPSSSTDARGAFAFRDLARGEYRLLLGEDWTPERPVTFREDAKGLRVVADRAWTAHLVVLDLATSDPIPRFLVRYRWPPDAADERVSEGSDGVFRARLRGGRGSILARVDAEGYHGSAAYAQAGSRNVWLARDVEPRLALRVQFEDGAPCEEDASVFAQHMGEPRNAILPTVRDGGGRYRVALPPGSWRIDFRPEHSEFFREQCAADVHLLAGERSETFLNLARGGVVVVRRKGWDGTPWALGVEVRGSGFVSTAVRAASIEMRHLKPDTYLLSARRPNTSPDDPEAGWQREVDVTAGSRQELTIE